MEGEHHLCSALCSCAGGQGAGLCRLCPCGQDEGGPPVFGDGSPCLSPEKRSAGSAGPGRGVGGRGAAGFLCRWSWFPWASPGCLLSRITAHSRPTSRGTLMKVRSTKWMLQSRDL